MMKKARNLMAEIFHPLGHRISHNPFVCLGELPPDRESSWKLG